MNKTLEFGAGSSIGNDTVFASPREWVWAKEGVGLTAVYDRKGYPTRNDLFFAVGWQVKTHRSAALGSTEPNSIIHLWVDSPRHEDNPTLNAVKQELVKALMNSGLHRMMQSKGYACDESHLRRTILLMQASRTTTVYKVKLTYSFPSLEEAITRVHADLGESVDETLQRFKTQLDALFA